MKDQKKERNFRRKKRSEEGRRDQKEEKIRRKERSEGGRKDQKKEEKIKRR